MKKQTRKITVSRETLLNMAEIPARVVGGNNTRFECTRTCYNTCLTVIGCH